MALNRYTSQVAPPEQPVAMANPNAFRHDTSSARALGAISGGLQDMGQAVAYQKEIQAKLQQSTKTTLTT